MDEEVIDNPLGTEKVGKLIFRFAVPSIIAIVVNSLYNMVDQLFIGQGVGYLGNAATNIIMPFTIMQMALAQMLGDGAAAWMSLNLGQGDSEKAAKGTGNAITITVILGIVMMILCEIFMVPLCQLFGASDNVLSFAVDYGRIIVLGFPFFSIACAYGSIIRADGRPNASMAGLLIGCIANIILDPIFILVFHWGVRGAALATIIGQILNAVFYFICILRCRTIQIKRRDLV